MTWATRVAVLGVVAIAACASAASAGAAPLGLGLGPAMMPATSERVLVLRRDGDAVRLLERGRIVQRPAARPGRPLEIAGTAADDTLRIDFAGGNPVPDGLVFDGGDEAGGRGDGLELVGGRFGRATVTFTPDRPGHGHDGVVVLDGTRIAFRDLEPLVLAGTAANLVVNLPQGDGANQTVLENDAGSQPTMSQLRSANASFETTAFTHPTSSLTINLGDDDAENLTVGDDSVGIPIFVNGGSGANTLTFADGETLAGGQFDGAGGSADRISYADHSTAASVDLGANAGLSASLGAEQEVPATSSTATGFATITYDNRTKLFDINVSVTGLAPAAVTGFHIHTAPVGVNGPVQVDFSAAALTPSGDGFTYAESDRALPAALEAALLGGGAYLNIHTAANPGGAIRGQLLAGQSFVEFPGSATGTGGISNVEHVTGGSAGDSIVGSNVANDLAGGGGGDTIVPARGADTISAGAGADLVTWSDGDGSDAIEGGADSDRVQVNGSDGATGDAFDVAANGSRVAFSRTTPIAFSLDIGGTETVSAVGRGGDDTLTTGSLAGVADLTKIELHGFAGADTLTAATLPAGVTAQLRGGQGFDRLVGPSGAWQVGPGADAGSLAGAVSFDTTESLTTGSGDDSVAVADGAGLRGTLDTSGGSDTLDFSAFSTAVRANLGTTVPALAATLGGDQVSPPTGSAATGTATLAFRADTGRFDLDVAVSGIDTTTISGFHLHRAAIGANGPAILDLAALLPPGGFPPGGGFNYSADNVLFPELEEAALLGGAIYVDVHTTALAGGAIRGQLLPAAASTVVPADATGFGVLAGVENVSGGAAGDGLVGSSAANHLRGGGGADVIVPAGGNDDADGDGGDDLIAWDDGDGSDTLEGDAGTDRVQVNGARGATGDVFTADAAGGRVALARTSPGPFALDIGTTERIAVAGDAGADTLTAGDFAGAANLSELTFHGGDGDDVMSVVPSTTVASADVGGPGADTLRFDGACLDTTTTPGTISAPGRQPVTHAGVETVSVASAIHFGAASGSFSESVGNASIAVTRTGTGSASVGYTTTALTATAGSDYTTTAGTLTFAAGESTATISVPVAHDAVVGEAPETFRVDLQSPGAFASVCSPAQFTATLTDAGAPPVTPPPPGPVTPPPAAVTPPAAPPPAVAPPPPPAPPPSSASRLPFAIRSITPSALTGGARVVLRFARRGSVAVVARRAGGPLVVARASARNRPAGTVRVTLRPTALGRRLLARTGRLRASVTATFTPAAGGSRARSKRTVTLRLRRPQR